MNILMRLIDRLGIELTDVVVENRNSTQKTLNQIDELIRLGQYEQANQLIEPISDKSSIKMTIKSGTITHSG